MRLFLRALVCVWFVFLALCGKRVGACWGDRAAPQGNVEASSELWPGPSWVGCQGCAAVFWGGPCPAGALGLSQLWGLWHM